MKKTNFERVAHFNNLIGNAEGKFSEIDWEQTVTRQLALIEEEFEELRQAVKTHDRGELRDAIADVLVTTYGLAHRAGIDADSDMDIVCDSNMSKFCSGPEVADATVAKYAQIGVEVRVEARGDVFAAISAKDQTGSDGKHYPEGKLLKGTGFFEPGFS